jgi:hypothetical protein
MLSLKLQALITADQNWKVEISFPDKTNYPLTWRVQPISLSINYTSKSIITVNTVIFFIVNPFLMARPTHCWYLPFSLSFIDYNNVIVIVVTISPDISSQPIYL